MISAIDVFVRFAISMLLAGLWQAPLFALAAWCVLRIRPTANATTRHTVLAAALLASLILPAITATLAMQTATPQMESQPQTDDVALPTGAAPYRPATTHPVPRTTTRMPSMPPPTLSVSSIARTNLAVPRYVALALVGLWLAGAAFVLLRLIVSLVHLERLKRDALPLGLDFRENLTRWASATKGPRDVRLCTSPEIDIPIAVGLFDAMILMPRHLLTELAPQEIDAIVLHELAHLRRSDDWFNALERFASAILFFNPAILWLAGQLDLEREVACDDWVLQQNDALPYATCLAKVAETAVWPHRPMTAPGAFVTRRGMSIRIERLLAKHRDVRIRTSFGPAGSAVTMLAMLGIVAAFVSPSIAYTVADTATPPIAAMAPVTPVTSLTPAKTIARTPHVAPHVAPPAPVAPKPPVVVAVSTPAARTGLVAPMTVRAIATPLVHIHIHNMVLPFFRPATHTHVRDADAEAGADSDSDSDAMATRDRHSPSPMIVAEADTPDYIDELASAGYTHLSVDDLVRLKSVGVDADFIRALERNGMKHPSVEELVRLRAIGVDPKYIAQMHARFGNSVSLDDISSMRAVGVSSDYADELAAAGLKNLDADQIRQLRALDVEPKYVRQLEDAGGSGFSVDEIAGLKAVAVDAPYVAEMRKQFGPSLDLNKLTGMRAVGVTPDYVAQLYAAGLTDVSPDRVTGLRALGISPAYVRSLARAGYKNLTADQVQQLRALDIDGDFIDRANAHGFQNLTVDQLIHLKVTGVL